MERRPIATAPMDGTRVRLFHENDPTESDFCPTYGSFEGGRWTMNQFFLIERDGLVLMATRPTHWAPMNTPEPA